MKKTLFVLCASLVSSIASAGALSTMASSALSVEVEGLSSKDSFSVIEKTQTSGNFEQVASFDNSAMRGETGYRSMGCSTGCSNGCSYGCSSGFSSGCSSGCSYCCR